MNRRRNLLAMISTVLIATAALCAGTASAHGLLQVDVLTHQDVFIPPWAVGGEYGADPRLTRKLNARLAQLRTAGTPTKVVLIAQRVDLEDVPYDFNYPVAYAAFLDQLLVSLRIFDGRLVVVMPDGSADIVADGKARALGLRPMMKNKWDIDAVLRTAIRAVAPSESAAAATNAQTRRRDWWPIAAGAFLAAIILAGGLLVLRRSRSTLNRTKQQAQPEQAR